MNKNGLLAQLSEEDQATVRGWAERAKNPKYSPDIPPELFVGAKLGIYYGWEARLTFGRGYSIGIDDDGKPIKIPYTWEMAVADVRAAEKVLYRQMINNGDILASANMACRDMNYAKSAMNFANQVKREVKDV